MNIDWKLKAVSNLLILEAEEAAGIVFLMRPQKRFQHAQ
jgi:hypothetical protein